METNICGAVSELADQNIDWAEAILVGDACPDARIAKVNFNSSRKINKVNFKINAKQKSWETRFKNRLNCPETDYDWTWTGSASLDVRSTGQTIAVGETLKISKVCNPDFVDGFGDACWKYDSEGWCYNEDQKYFVTWGTYYDSTEQIYQTGLNCPQCGCTETYITPLTDFPVEDLTRSVEKSGRK